jgi:hypothetical protein
MALASIFQLADEIGWDDERLAAAAKELVEHQAIVADLRAGIAYCPHVIHELPSWALAVEPDWIVGWMRPVPRGEVRDRIEKDLAKVFGLKAGSY